MNVERIESIEKVVEQHGASVEDYYVFGQCVYMIIEQAPNSRDGLCQYAIKVNDLDTDLPNDGAWLSVNGNSRYETIGGASRALLQHLEENQ